MAKFVILKGTIKNKGSISHLQQLNKRRRNKSVRISFLRINQHLCAIFDLID